MRALPPDPRQLRLFAEFVETTTTGDVPFEDPDGSWGSRIARPAGKGWRVVDYSHDKRTTWTRRLPAIPKKTGRGGWRRR